MRVKSIRPAGRADVYNMEVAETHDFAVNGGVIVHNCYDECRYVCMKNPIAARVHVTPAVKGFDPLSTDDLTKRPADYGFYTNY